MKLEKNLASFYIFGYLVQLRIESGDFFLKKIFLLKSQKTMKLRKHKTFIKF